MFSDGPCPFETITLPNLVWPCRCLLKMRHRFCELSPSNSVITGFFQMAQGESDVGTFAVQGAAYRKL
jgi:hypothetical protein